MRCWWEGWRGVKGEWREKEGWVDDWRCCRAWGVGFGGGVWLRAVLIDSRLGIFPDRLNGKGQRSATLVSNERQAVCVCVSVLTSRVG